jgi:type I restriction enzyme S subunit
MSWKNVPLRQLLTQTSMRDRADLPLLSVVREKGVILRSRDKNENHNVIPEDLSNYKIVSKGQFVINKMKAWQGSCGVSQHDGIVSPAYFVFDLHIDNEHFFNYAIRSRDFIDKFGRISKGIRVGQWDLDLQQLKYIQFFLPPREEQDQIARYLDWKVSLINRLIAAKRRQIALLKEQKQAIISKLLCGEMVWLKRLLIKPFQYGANNSGVEFSKNLPRYIRITDITIDGKLKHNNAKSLSIEVAEPYILSDGDMLFARSGATAGKSFLFKAEYGLSAFAGYLIRARIDTKRILPKYLSYVTNSSYYEKWKNGVFIQATIQNISAERYGQLPIPLPPIDKQCEIIAYLDNKCSAIDKVTVKLNDEIALFTEYRARLISDVVTGKLDVRAVAIPKYEMAKENITADNDELFDDENITEENE